MKQMKFFFGGGFNDWRLNSYPATEKPEQLFQWLFQMHTVNAGELLQQEFIFN